LSICFAVLYASGVYKTPFKASAIQEGSMRTPTIVMGVIAAIFAGSLLNVALRADDRDGRVNDSRAKIGLAYVVSVAVT